MSSRGRGTRHDKGLVLSLVTRHFSLLPDGAAVDLGHHCRVVARGLVLARAARRTRRRVCFAVVVSTFSSCGYDSAVLDDGYWVRKFSCAARDGLAFVGITR